MWPRKEQYNDILPHELQKMPYRTKTMRRKEAAKTQENSKQGIKLHFNYFMPCCQRGELVGFDLKIERMLRKGRLAIKVNTMEKTTLVILDKAKEKNLRDPQPPRAKRLEITRKEVVGKKDTTNEVARGRMVLELRQLQQQRVIGTLTMRSKLSIVKKAIQGRTHLRFTWFTIWSNYDFPETSQPQLGKYGQSQAVNVCSSGDWWELGETTLHAVEANREKIYEFHRTPDIDLKFLGCQWRSWPPFHHLHYHYPKITSKAHQKLKFSKSNEDLDQNSRIELLLLKLISERLP
ncbi:hypothetical protein M9H77_30368 [Catharanthus roseus]|uniref:Uncharacterized protein n=1 Tax=Catharanthus roseus TaxID=4058 RepID=A0ACB9ZXX8_CATRO|nr:hypothetical protein M9H77_30368 [Catharanthus roseus]